MRTSKRVCDSSTEQQYLIRPCHLNHYGRLFGGELLQWIDEVAGIVAIRHSNALVTTAAIDNLQFKAPAFAGDMVVLKGCITCVGRSSMEVRVDTYIETIEGDQVMINRAYIDMVAIDADGNTVEVPELIIESPEQQQEYLAAQKRKEMRKQRRLEGF